MMTEAKEKKLKDKLKKFENGFVLEEYKMKWEYIKHIESQRVDIVKWYVFILGSILTFLSVTNETTENCSKDTNFFNSLLGNGEWAFILSFLLLLAIFISIYILFQKKNYNIYNKRRMDIEQNFIFLEKEDNDRVFFSVFRIQFLMFSLFGSGLSGLLAYISSGSYKYAILFGVIYFGFMFLLSIFIVGRTK